jgi:hypothetical protein
MDFRWIWNELVRAAGCRRQYRHLEEYLKTAPPEVLVEVHELLQDLEGETRSKGRRAASAAYRKGQFGI